MKPSQSQNKWSDLCKRQFNWQLEFSVQPVFPEPRFLTKCKWIIWIFMFTLCHKAPSQFYIWNFWSANTIILEVKLKMINAFISSKCHWLCSSDPFLSTTRIQTQPEACISTILREWCIQYFKWDIFYGLWDGFKRSHDMTSMGGWRYLWCPSQYLSFTLVLWSKPSGYQMWTILLTLQL